MTPMDGTLAAAITAIKREIECAWFAAFASVPASAPGVSIKVTIGIARRA